MEQGLTKIDSRGGTAMRDAIRLSMEHLKEGAKRDKKVILVVTDGNDNASHDLARRVDAAGATGRRPDLRHRAADRRGPERGEERRSARCSFSRRAPAAPVFYPKDVSEVDRIAHQVARDIRNQYTIAYTPSNAALDGTFRQIKVVVKAPGNPVARTRSGYYASKDQPKTPKKPS